MAYLGKCASLGILIQLVVNATAIRAAVDQRVIPEGLDAAEQSGTLLVADGTCTSPLPCCVQ